MILHRPECQKRFLVFKYQGQLLVVHASIGTFSPSDQSYLATLSASFMFTSVLVDRLYCRVEDRALLRSNLSAASMPSGSSAASWSQLAASPTSLIHLALCDKSRGLGQSPS